MTAEPAPRWGLGDAAIGLLPFTLLGIAALSGDDSDAEPTIAGLVGASLVLWLFLIGVPVVATRIKGRGPVADLGLRFRPADAGPFVLGVALQAVAVPALYWPIFRLTDVDSDDVADQARDLVDSASGVGVAVLVLVVAVGAPFAEELFYRGLLLRATERRWGTPVALIGTTAVFGLSHLQGIQLPALLLFGAVAGTLAVRSGRLGPAMACHAGFNAWTLFVLLVLDW